MSSDRINRHRNGHFSRETSIDGHKKLIHYKLEDFDMVKTIGTGEESSVNVIFFVPFPYLSPAAADNGLNLFFPPKDFFILLVVVNIGTMDKTGTSHVLHGFFFRGKAVDLENGYDKCTMLA